MAKMVDIEPTRLSQGERDAFRDHVSRLRNSPEVADALGAAEVALVAPQVTREAFVGGVDIDGHLCRLTRGTVALLEMIDSPLIREAREGEAEEWSPEDIARAIFVMADETRSQAVAALFAGDMDFDRTARRFIRRIKDKYARPAVLSYFAAVGEALDTGSSSGALPPPDEWAIYTDIICNAYGWELAFVLWELPFVTGARLMEAIVYRKTGKRRPRGGGSETVAALKAIEAAAEQDEEFKKARKASIHDG